MGSRSATALRHFAIVGAGVTVVCSTAAQPRAADDVVVEKNVEGRMRDGVVLRADVYRPSGEGRYPVLLQRTPYSKHDESDVAAFRALAAAGYLVVVQDTRGRYMSDGVARPHDEAADGFDSVQWAAALPRANGRVGMFGGSYLATTQLMAASEQPPALVALFPSASYASRYDMVFQGGAFYLNDGLGWNIGQAIDVRRRVLTPEVERDGPIGMSADERQAFRDRWLWHVPLNTMAVLDLRRFAPGYFELLAHPSYDGYWERFDIARRHDRFLVPAYHITGWYDTLLTGTLRNFAGLRAHAGTDRARRFQRLLVGPWTHARPTRATRKVGDVDFGPDAGVESADELLQWYDYWLKDDRSARTADVETRAPVRLFVMGENRWRDEQEWPLARATPTAYYLHSDGRANSLHGDGTLSSEPQGSERADRYTYDPWDPVPTGPLGGYSRMAADQRPIEARSDVLVYSTPPLERAVEVTGPLTLTLWIASSAPDTDFTGKLVDVLPDGTARALNDGIRRARYRASMTQPSLLHPGEPTEVTIDVGATSNLFQVGHRIRLEVSSSNFPRFDRNPNTGGTFGEDAELRRADQTVFHDAAHPSRLVLPIVPRSSQP
ncbi:MAG: CocE/NonD family hydrolase [Vicinamibacterales bacterium]